MGYFDDLDDLRHKFGGDLYYAFGYNIGVDSLKLVDDCILEITGEHDEASWHWILKLKDGQIAYASGWCDYTGWDCQSGADWEITDSLEKALQLAPQDIRRVFEDMLARGETVRPNTGGL